MTISLTEDKIAKFYNSVKKFQSGHKYTIRKVAELVGFLNSVCVAVPLGRLFTKVIEINKASALNINKGDFNAVMRLSSADLGDIDWWCVNISNSFAPVQRGTPSVTLTTDASLVGWGAECLGLSTGGQWSEEELNFSNNINYLELQAVFLGMKKYFQNAGYSALNTARSALSSFISVNNVPVGKHALVIRFMKGAFNIKPSLPRYIITWDVNIVLKFLKDLPSLDTISLKFLTYKLVMLTALVTGQRCQTLRFLDLNYYDVVGDNVCFRIMNLLKQSRPGVHLNAVDLKKYRDSDLCVVRTLEVYIHRTAHLRGDHTQLFITHSTPFKPVACATIARWIKQFLS
ncbi:unnamed protein product [Mytilus coruscus]|uniref:Tyr recombinase domain-containing protein n=1 Tax=Mytilus coruscus TaxID=42192 RepID=A0A6J8AQB7_MYTCO|nr:unnamed protein product [Mytilus coruscus]